MNEKIAIVVPCHLPPSEAWIAALKSEADANKAQVIIVDDSDGNLGKLPFGWEVFDYLRQEDYLGELYDEFARLFHKCAACRVFGHLVAYKEGYDVIIGLDSDCIVERNFVRDHIQFLGKPFGSGWFNPIGYPHYSRGYPYSQREWPIVANMGLWKNVLDINGKDRQSNEPKEIKIMGSTVPNGVFPFSGMNFALARDAILGFLFLPNFNDGDDDFRRIDDVWGGYIFQKLLRKLHQSTMVGYPIVLHDTIVDAKADTVDEEAMCKHEDSFIEMVDRVCENMEATTQESSMVELMDNFITHMNIEIDVPFDDLISAFIWWREVIKKYA